MQHDDPFNFSPEFQTLPGQPPPVAENAFDN
jgi:hypothetical protein